MMETSVDVSVEKTYDHTMICFFNMLYTVTTCASFVVCSASDSNESQETCVDCAPSSRGRYLSTDRCVGESVHEWSFSAT